MKKYLKVRLSLMMFLQFFIWGSWYSAIVPFMSAHGMGHLSHWAFTLSTLGAVLSPVFAGLLADRCIPAEKLLGISHLLGGLSMAIAVQTAGSPLLFHLLLLLHSFSYAASLCLVNTLSFHHLSHPEQEFPRIRLFGTIGWMIAGLVLDSLYMASAAGLFLGFYSFFLPQTRVHPPPSAKDKPISVRSRSGTEETPIRSRSVTQTNAVRPGPGTVMMQSLRTNGGSYGVFLGCSLLMSIPLAAYYNFTQIFLRTSDFENIAALQVTGQISEVLFMLLMPLFLIRYGMKWMLCIGLLAWVFRYLLFAMGSPDGARWMILIGITLHGICYDFFFIAGQMVADQKADRRVRGQAQGWIICITYGLGMILGGQVMGFTYTHLLEEHSLLMPHQWQSFWWIPSIISGIVLLIFSLTFSDRRALNRMRKVSQTVETDSVKTDG